MTTPVRELAAFAETRGTHEDDAAPPRARRSDALRSVRSLRDELDEP